METIYSSIRPLGGVACTLHKIEANCGDSEPPQYAWVYFDSHATGEAWKKENTHRLKVEKGSELTTTEGWKTSKDTYIRKGSLLWEIITVISQR